MKIICFLSSLSQPRCIKRVTSFANAGFEVEVYGYSRGFYDINDLPGEIKTVSWGKISSGGGYLRRMKDIVKNMRRIIGANKDNEVLYYAFGFDFSVVLSILKPYCYIYESSDLIYTYRNRIFSILFEKIDKSVIRKSYRTVFTSEGFQYYLFKDNIPGNIIIQPNKVSSYFLHIDRQRQVYDSKIGKGLVFAYVGAFRYPNTVFRFARIIGERYPQHRFYFYGDSQLTYLAKELSEKYENIKYFGKFKSPEDLGRIYSTIDVVTACYDTSTVNERIAEPNKLYEAICFCKPIIVSEGTFLESKVKKYNIGFAINADNDKSIMEFLDQLNYDVLNTMSHNELNMSIEEYIDSPKSIIQALTDFGN